MTLMQELLELEHGFWTGGPDFYRAALDPHAIFVLPDPVGILGRDQVVESIVGAPRWHSVELDSRRLLELSPSSAVLVYRALAERVDDSEPYTAFVSSAYRRSDGVWRLAHHQQTPIRK